MPGSNDVVARLEARASQYERVFDKIATWLRTISWTWIIGSAILVIAEIEFLMLQTPDGLGAAALISVPAAVGLVAAFVIQRLYFLGHEL